MPRKKDDPEEQDPCPECEGVGWVEVVVMAAVDGNDAVRLSLCPECQGSGELVQQPEATQPE